MKAIIVTGSRDWSDLDAIAVRLQQVMPDVVIHGAAKGADELADKCKTTWRHMIPMPAQWERDGKRAGPLRNAQMLTVLCALRQCGYEVSVEAFPGPNSRGTWDMVRRARLSHVPVNVNGPHREPQL